MSRPARYLVFAQGGFFLALAVCVLIRPEGLHANHGWSYYEERDETIVPYLLGAFGCIFLVVYAASLFERSGAPSGLPHALRVFAALLLLDVATPDTVNSFFYWAHNLASTLLFLFELGFAIWLVRTIWTSRIGLALLGLQFVGGLVAMLSQLHLISRLGLGIFIFQASFCALLVAATARIPDSELEPSQEPILADLNN